MLWFYVEVARTAYRRQLIYRWANLAGLLTNCFFAAVGSFVAIALYQTRVQANGFHLHDTLRYIWVVQAMIMVVLPFGWGDLMRTIRSGEVVADLSKPCDFFWYWCSRECGRGLYYLLFRAAPTYLIGMLLFGLGAPAGSATWPLFAASLCLGAALGIAYRFLYNVVSFWIVEGRAAVSLAENLALFCTGAFVPLAYFPNGLRALLFELGRQLSWVIVLIGVARLLTASATRRVVSQGG